MLKFRHMERPIRLSPEARAASFSRFAVGKSSDQFLINTVCEWGGSTVGVSIKRSDDGNFLFLKGLWLKLPCPCNQKLKKMEANKLPIFYRLFLVN